MSLYSVRGLVKTYQARKVLDIDQLTIDTDNIYALLGPNGAGKTTLLNILAFLEKPDQGRVTFRSQPVAFHDLILQKLRKDVVIVDQHPILFTTTVFKNVEFGLKIRGLSRKQRYGLVEEALELVDMRSFMQAPAHRLSGGETQRVALARALAVSPKVFLCDEPMASVDIENQVAILDILKQINAEKRITIIFTTHDRSQAAALAHHTLMLHHGRMVPTTYENLFQADLQPTSNQHLNCIIHKRFVIPLSTAIANGRTGRSRVYIDPAMIKLADHIDTDSPPVNGFTGRLVSVSEENGRVRLVVDTGVAIHVLMPYATYAKFRLAVGDRVKLRIQPEAVHIY